MARRAQEDPDVKECPECTSEHPDQGAALPAVHRAPGGHRVGGRPRSCESASAADGQSRPSAVRATRAQPPVRSWAARPRFGPLGHSRPSGAGPPVRSRAARPELGRPSRPRFAALLARGCWLWDHGDHAPTPSAGELHGAGRAGEDRVIPADSHAVTGMKPGAALANDDLAAGHGLAGEYLDAEALGVGVTAVTT